MTSKKDEDFEWYHLLIHKLIRKEAKASCDLDGETQWLMPDGKTPCGKTTEEILNKKGK